MRDKKLKLEDLNTHWVDRGKGYLRRGTRIRDERIVSVRGECVILNL